MPIEIHGKEYITVAERVRAMLDDHQGQLIALATEITSETAQTVTVKATVTLSHGTFTGHAQSHKSAGSVEGQAPLEVAETSAVGRALGFAGYGMVDSIASAEEVVVAQGRSAQPSRPQSRPTGIPPLDDPMCSFCGAERVFKQGTNKKGNPYKGWFCPTKDCEAAPIWVRDERPQLDLQAPDDLPFE